MAARIPVSFVGESAEDRTIAVDNQATVNLVQAIKGRGAKSSYVLESAPGLVDRGVAGDGPVRTSQMVSSSIRGAGKDLYGVYGSKLVAQTATSGNINVGTVGIGSTRCPIARGRNYIMVVDGTNGYTYDGTTFQQIVDLDFPGQAGPGKPTHCLYLDGFFITNDALTDNFFISALEDPTSWNALDFEAASVAPDNALGMAASESLLWIVGDETAQAYYNSGNQDFPYEVVLTATQEVGVLAPDSIAESDDGIFFLATTPEGGRFVYQITGQAGRVITADAQEAFLQTVADPSTAYGFVYKQAGKSFYALQLPASGGPSPRSSSTLVYNIKAQAWESRELQDGTAWRAGGHGILADKNIVGSRLQARNLELSLTAYQDSGQELIRRRRTEIFHSNGHALDWWSVVVDVQGGVGNQLAPGDNPLLKLRYSNDSGQTWSSWLLQPLGRIGETLQRAQFLNLGSARNRVFEIEYSEPTNLTIINAYAVVQVLAD